MTTERLTVALSQLRTHDRIIEPIDGGPDDAWTVTHVQIIGSSVIVDFRNGTSLPPTKDALVTVLRASEVPA